MLSALFAWFLSDPLLPPATSDVGPRDHARLPARDGTLLWTGWRLPEGDGPFPTIVTRSPYPISGLLDGQCRIYTARGYACVWQEVRGRGRSAGVWDPFVNEERDGQDLVRWIAAQPWSDGKVAWVGESYMAGTGWTVVPEDPDGVSTLVSRIFAPASYDAIYEDGLLRHELITAWMAIMPDERDNLAAAGRYRRALAHRPRSTMDEVASGHPIPWFRTWVAAEDPADPAWTEGDPRRFAESPARTFVPVMLVGGWSDAFIQVQIDAWGSLASKDKSLLVVGPWAHLGQVPADFPLAEVDSAVGGGGSMFQLPRILDWYDHHVRGQPARSPMTGAITYVVGGDRWEVRPDWPPETTERRYVATYSADRCAGRLEQGSGAPLSTPMAYAYDPADPFPSRGGAGLLAGAIPGMRGVPPGFLAAANPCPRRADLLRFESAPLAAPLHLAGSVAVELDVASDAPDTAFGFRLLERRADGVEYVLREGFSTLALRDGGPKKPYTPGDRVRVVPDGAPLEAELHAGSTLVLVVTSSSFPAYEAHPNVAGRISEATATVVANQQVFGATLVIPEVAARTVAAE